MPTINLLKSVRSRNLLEHAKDEKSSDVAGRETISTVYDAL